MQYKLVYISRISGETKIVVSSEDEAKIRAVFDMLHDQNDAIFQIQDLGPDRFKVRDLGCEYAVIKDKK